MKPPPASEPILTGRIRKTLLQQQTEYTVRDPSTHAARQVYTYRTHSSKFDMGFQYVVHASPLRSCRPTKKLASVSGPHRLDHVEMVACVEM